MGAAREPLERLDPISLSTAVGTGRMVPSVDRVAKRDTDRFGLPVDLDKSSSVQPAEIQRPLGVESCAW